MLEYMKDIEECDSVSRKVNSRAKIHQVCLSVYQELNIAF